MANLTNGNKASTSSVGSQEGPSTLFSTKTFPNQNASLFTTSDMTKPISSLFEKPSSSLSSTKSPESKTDSKMTESLFKIPVTSTPTNNFNFSPKSTFGNPCNTASQTTNNLFGGQTESIFAKNSSNMTSTTTSSALQSKMCESVEDNNKKEIRESDGDKDKIDEKKLKYYTNLKGLNISVSDWIKKHVDESPVCILSPIFKDYEKHLKEIQNEYFNSDKEKVQSAKSNGAQGDFDQNSKSETKLSSATPASNMFFQGTSSTNKTLDDKKNSSITFGIPPSNNTLPKGTGSSFSFGIQSQVQSPTTSSSTVQSLTNKPFQQQGFSFGSNKIIDPPSISGSGGFTFGLDTSPPTKPMFSSKPVMSNTNGSSQFSFGTGKPFSFNSNIQRKDDENEDKSTKDEDEPPKVEYTPMVEENSIFDKKCKIFVKKDGNFVDKGVGTLYIKKIEDSGKHQLLVRANTSLGNILLNLLLNSSIPTQRMGKNNVMLVCIPTSDAKPPPTPVLIRVKTSEEADELLEKLNNYKQ